MSCNSEALGRVVGQEASVDLLIKEFSTDLIDQPYEITRAADGWMARHWQRLLELNA